MRPLNGQQSNWTDSSPTEWTVVQLNGQQSNWMDSSLTPPNYVAFVVGYQYSAINTSLLRSIMLYESCNMINSCSCSCNKYNAAPTKCIRVLPPVYHFPICLVYCIIPYGSVMEIGFRFCIAISRSFGGRYCVLLCRFSILILDSESRSKDLRLQLFPYFRPCPEKDVRSVWKLCLISVYTCTHAQDISTARRQAVRHKRKQSLLVARHFGTTKLLKCTRYVRQNTVYGSKTRQNAYAMFSGKKYAPIAKNCPPRSFAGCATPASDLCGGLVWASSGDSTCNLRQDMNPHYSRSHILTT